MVILTLDTSGDCFFGLLQRNEQIFGEIRIEVGNRQAELLLVLVENFLTENKISYGELDCLSVVNGPGSFMGLKVSMAFLKALRCVFPKIKIILNSVFQIISFRKNFDFVLLEADRDGFYVFDSEQNSFYLKKEEFCNRSNRDSRIITNSNNIVDFLKSYNSIIGMVDAESIASLNHFRYSSGRFDTGEIEPIYIRESQVKARR
jgi:tRNA threonylcarbamoyl adenosine modification protein YeaZ